MTCALHSQIDLSQRLERTYRARLNIAKSQLPTRHSCPDLLDE